MIMENTFKNTFRIYDSNADLDIYSKRAALKSSETMASLVSFVGKFSFIHVRAFERRLVPFHLLTPFFKNYLIFFEKFLL